MAHGKRPRGFLPIKVGGGKTLVSFLAPRMMNAKRPRLILPAHLVEKTENDMRKAAVHWKVAKHMKIYSYQRIGRVEGAGILEADLPDMLIFDEGHYLKNTRAAVTRRVAQYIKGHPECVVVIMSGTIMKDSIKNFAHLIAWTHGQHSPLPLEADALRDWADALDEGLNPMSRRSPGILLDLYPYTAPDASDEPIRLARQKFNARLNDTLGVVSADAKEEYGGSIFVEAIEYKPNNATEDNFVKLREEKCRPDGWSLTEAMQEWAVARMLSLGLHYEWDSPVSDEWLDARKQWAKYVRTFLASPGSEGMGIDSELQVTNAVLDGRLADTWGLLAAWREIKPTFTPNSVAVWHDRTALQVCSDWLADHPKGICWVEHRLFASTLSKITGIPYYGAKGLDPKGNFIDNHPGGPIIASVAANSSGRNLQHKWADNLITAPAPDSDRWEQLLARTHRYGQQEDSIGVDVLLACREHLESIPRALSASEVKLDLIGSSQKLLKVADIEWPTVHTLKYPQGMRWT